MKNRDLFDFLCAFAPLGLQLGFDNAGFLVGDIEAGVSRVLISLDVTEEVIDEAVRTGVELIISHHPFIWTPLKSVTGDGLTSRKLMKLIKNDISVISMHTNLDIAEGGVNDVLISLLGAVRTDTLDSDGCGRIGELQEELCLEEFLVHCRSVLNVKGLRYVDGGRRVKRLAVMGGAGADAMYDAIEKGCDTYVTADVKYHQFLEAKELGLNLIDADHFCTENPVMPVLAEKLRVAFPALDVHLSAVHSQVVSFI